MLSWLRKTFGSRDTLGKPLARMTKDELAFAIGYWEMRLELATDYATLHTAATNLCLCNVEATRRD